MVPTTSWFLPWYSLMEPSVVSARTLQPHLEFTRHRVLQGQVNMTQLLTDMLRPM